MNNGNNKQPTIPYWKTSQVILATLFIMLVGLGFWLIISYRGVIFTLLIAIVLSTAINPIVDRLHQRGLPRALGVILVYLLLLAFVVGFVLLAAPLVLDQAANVATIVPQDYAAMQKGLSNSPAYFIRLLGNALPPTLQLSPPANPAAKPEEQALNQVTQVLAYAGVLSHGLFTALAIFLLGFYWTLEGERTIRSILLLLPAARRDEVRDIINEAQSRVGGFVFGQVIMCVTIGAMALVAYIIIGVPYAVLLALIAAVMEAVPIFGPFLGALPAFLLVLSLNDTNKLVFLVISTIVIQLSENHILIPRIVSKSVGVNAIVALLSLAAFTSLFGFPGALLAIPIAAVIQFIFDRYILRPETVEADKPGGRDRYSALRLEAQEISNDVRKQVRDKDGTVDRAEDRAEDSLEAIANDLDRVLAQSKGGKEPA